MEEQYNNIGAIYQEFKSQATLPIAEKFTFFKLLGNLEGKKILDLGASHFCTLAPLMWLKPLQLRSLSNAFSKMGCSP